MEIREARVDEAAAAAALIRRSITELCAEDYRHDTLVLERWLANKTEANLRRWIEAPNGSVVVVCSQDRQLAAVGMLRRDGEILLNYVDPAARFKGFSNALLKHMEDLLRQSGCLRVALFSSSVARRLYLSNGYAAVREVESLFGTLPATEMTKRL